MERNTEIVIPKLKTGETVKTGFVVIRDPDVSEFIQKPERSEISETIKEWLMKKGLV